MDTNIPLTAWLCTPANIFKQIWKWVSSSNSEIHVHAWGRRRDEMSGLLALLLGKQKTVKTGHRGNPPHLHQMTPRWAEDKVYNRNPEGRGFGFGVMAGRGWAGRTPRAEVKGRVHSKRRRHGAEWGPWVSREHFPHWEHRVQAATVTHSTKIQMYACSPAPCVNEETMAFYLAKGKSKTKLEWNLGFPSQLGALSTVPSWQAGVGCGGRETFFLQK